MPDDTVHVHSEIEFTQDIHTSQNTDLQIDHLHNVLDVFAALHTCARQMAELDAPRSCRSACGHIIHASRKAEELLQPYVIAEVVPERSDVFTLPTAQAGQQHPSGEGTEVTWSVADDTGTPGAEASNLPDAVSSGDTVQKRQALEQKLLELRNGNKTQRNHDIASALHELGILSWKDGDLKQGKLHYEESLRMKRSVHGDMDHPDIAVTLHELSILSQKAGDFKQAELHLEESLRMSRSLHGDIDHPDIAETLHELGILSQKAGDFKQSKLHYEGSLRMNRSLHGGTSITQTLHQLGILSQKAGDLKQAKLHYQESLRMKRSLYGDMDHPDIAATLHQLGSLRVEGDDLEQAKLHYEESLRMERSLHGDMDHPDIAAIIALTQLLHELGRLEEFLPRPWDTLSQQAGDFKRSNWEWADIY